jgi:uncharacterized protein
MTLMGRAVAGAFDLPQPQTRRVRATRAIGVRMRDGVTLRTDHLAPDLPEAPTILVRTPYGRGGPIGMVCRAAAEQGFHVVVQSCRGTHDSGGYFEPMRHEREDGLDTLAWLRLQPWYTGELCTFGTSYVGFAQWALAADAKPDLKAMATVATASDFRSPTYAGGSFSWDTVLTWAALLSAQRGPRLSGAVELLRGQPRLRRGLAHLPLREADLVATGAEVAFIRDWLADPGDDYWAERGHVHRVSEVDIPVLMVGGWYDIFLPWQLRDYATLRAAGARPYLTVGPWTHGSFGMARQSLREAVHWFRAHTGQRAAVPREQPVRLHIGGADRWRDFADWPPAGAGTRDWFLAAGGRLTPTVAEPDAAVHRFRYDPADPTPALGGPRLVANVAGRRDNRPLEARPDVLVYSSAPLTATVSVAGPVTATVYTRAGGEHFDVFVRLCDVDVRGRSWNVCDGLIRVTPGALPRDGDGVQAVAVELWPTAYEFRPGHRIRVQVSGGAHPRFARNTGTGEPLATATRLRALEQAVLTGPRYPSAVHLSVLE